MAWDQGRDIGWSWILNMSGEECELDAEVDWKPVEEFMLGAYGGIQMAGKEDDSSGWKMIEKGEI